MSIKRFSIVGLINTFFGLLIIFLAKLTGLDDISSNLIGYACGIMLSFRLNSTWTFNYKGHQLKAFMKFIIIIIVAYFANLATVLFIINSLHINSYIAQPLGILPYTLITYLGSKHIAFSN